MVHDAPKPGKDAIKRLDRAIDAAQQRVQAAEGPALDAVSEVRQSIQNLRREVQNADIAQSDKAPLLDQLDNLLRRDLAIGAEVRRITDEFLNETGGFMTDLATRWRNDRFR